MMEQAGNFYRMIDSMIEEHKASKKKLTTKDLMDEIAIKLKIYQDKKGLTQEGLADTIGVTRRQIIRWKKKESLPSKLAMKRMRDLEIV